MLPAAAGPVVRRLGSDGQELARAATPAEPGLDRVAWYITPEGGVYTLGWLWSHTGAGLLRAQVYELLAPDLPPDPRAAPPLSPPVVLHRPVPDSIQITAPDAPPLTVADPVALHNIWALLASLTHAFAPEPPPARPLPPDWPAPGAEPLHLVARWPDSRALAIDLWQGAVRLDGGYYDGGTSAPAVGEQLERLVRALLLEPGALRAAISQPQTAVEVAVLDLPGMARPLDPRERQALAMALQEATLAHIYSTPQPLEDPFPRYALILRGQGWQLTAPLRGEHHLAPGQAVALTHHGELSRLVREWLPLPASQPGELADLYRATGLEIRAAGQSQDLTRWKDTVVRYLLGVLEPSGNGWTEPLTLVFTVDGAPRVVEVDASGFSYAGRRYHRPGLTDLIGLQGVP